jgi:Na+-driven multidrug efflux pump
MRVFIKDAAIVADGSVMLRWQIAGMAFAGIVLLYTCLFQASGKALQALILSLSRQGILFIGVFFLLTSLLKYQGFLMSQPAADLFSALLAILLFVLTFRNKPGDQD